MNKQSSNKRLFLLEFIFYVLLPYVIWNFGREPLGDYIAILVSTVPSIILVKSNPLVITSHTIRQ